MLCCQFCKSKLSRLEPGFYWNYFFFWEPFTKSVFFSVKDALEPVDTVIIRLYLLVVKLYANHLAIFMETDRFASDGWRSAPPAGRGSLQFLHYRTILCFSRQNHPSNTIIVSLQSFYVLTLVYFRVLLPHNTYCRVNVDKSFNMRQLFFTCQIIVLCGIWFKTILFIAITTY